MKRLILIVSLFILLLMTGCSKESKIKIEKKQINFSVKEDTLTLEKATFVLQNKMKDAVSYDEAYWLEKKKENKWYRMDPIKNISFNFPLSVLEAKKSREIEIDWKNGYGKLSKGTYRLVKKITTMSNTTKYIAARFVVKK